MTAEAGPRTGGGRTGRLVVLVGAVLTTGLTAGVFADWAHTIMPGLRSTDDRTFVGVLFVLDRAILNAPFLLAFMGGLVLTGVAVVLSRRGEDRAVLAWVAPAFVLHLAVFVITMVVHEPLNVVIRGVADPAGLPDPAGVRAAFDEARWAVWHLVRTVATTVALGCLAGALVLAGRDRGVTGGPAVRTAGPGRPERARGRTR